MHGRNGFANVNGTQLYYEITGEGPPLVLIHGFALDRRMWDEQLPAFTPAYQVIRYDLRGFGWSAVPSAERYAHCEDLQALLDYLQVEQAHILGLSLGGGIAVDFAAAYPERTANLILAGTSALDGYEWPDELAGWFAQFAAAAHSGDMALAKERWLSCGWFVHAQRQPAVMAQLWQMAADYSGWHFLHKNPVRGLKPPANERLAEITAPTLVIVGAEDLSYYNLPLADRLASQIPHAQKIVIPGVGHMVNMEAAARFNDVVLSFLR
ncbi:MAG TPA: alpha/beta fold hydrolase [Chloroflexota bacterium]|nr:alpha/beta fold hydrolase [Chloroflexota bacterium]